MPDFEHIIVLMLENRSFDHLLGFLDHPDPAFFDHVASRGRSRLNRARR